LGDGVGSGLVLLDLDLDLEDLVVALSESLPEVLSVGFVGLAVVSASVSLR